MTCPSPWAQRKPDLLAIAAIGVHLALALSLRVTAWPEVTTPSYLWSRGMLVYRDIKFSHAPGTMATLALSFLAFGVHTWLVRAYAIVWPLIAHLFILRHTRSFAFPERAVASAFFLTFFFTLDGNAVWPTVVMTAVALPIAAALSRGHVWRASLLIGAAILFKQTAAYVLFVSALALALERRWSDAGRLLLAGCIPYWVTVAIFALLGAGADMLRWTLEVPFTIPAPTAVFRPTWYDASVLVFMFLPTIGEAALERPGDYEVRSRWLLIVAIGFAAICYPRFAPSQTVAAIPCLAVGTARFLRRRVPIRWFRAAAYGFVVTYTVSCSLILFGASDFDGKVLFWNHEPALDALAARLHEVPRDMPLYSPLWDNVLPRAGLLPPGRLYVNPFFDFFFQVDDVGRRIQSALRQRGAVAVGYRGSASGPDVIGPYRIYWIRPQPVGTTE